MVFLCRLFGGWAFGTMVFFFSVVREANEVIVFMPNGCLGESQRPVQGELHDSMHLQSRPDAHCTEGCM